MKSARRPLLTVYSVLFVAFILRIANLTGESLWRDEVDSVRFAFAPLSELLGNFTGVGFNGPLYHLIVRGWLSLAGVNDFALRYLSLVFGVLLVALVYVLGKRLFGERAALIAMWLAAIAPILIWYAGEGKMYSLQPMLFTLALYALLRVIGNLVQSPIFNLRSLIWWAVFIVASSLSFYVQLLSPLFLPVAALFFFALWPHSRQHVVGGLIALALLTLPYVPLAIWQAPTFLQGGNIGHIFYPLDQMALALLSNWTLGLDERAPLLNLSAPDALVSITRWSAMVLLIAIAFYGFMEAATCARQCEDGRLTFRLQPATLAWLTLPTILVFIVSTRIPIFQPRYLLWSAPALYLLVSGGLARLLEHGRVGKFAHALALGVISLVSLSGVTSQIVNPIRPDLRGAVAFVTQMMQPGDVIVFQIPYAQHSFEYYARQFGRSIDPAQMIEAPYTNAGMNEEEVAYWMSHAAPPSGRAWLFETEAPLWDARGLVRAWFDEQLVLVERRMLRGVDVGLYQITPH